MNVISGEVTISVESRSLDNKKRVSIQKEIASIVKKEYVVIGIYLVSSRELMIKKRFFVISI